MCIRDRIRDYLDEIRANLPGELRQAQQIVNDRAQIGETANAQAQAIVKKAAPIPPFRSLQRN